MLDEKKILAKMDNARKRGACNTEIAAISARDIMEQKGEQCSELKAMLIGFTSAIILPAVKNGIITEEQDIFIREVAMQEISKLQDNKII